MSFIAGAWLLNQIIRTLRLRNSEAYELRATYSHLRGVLLSRRVGISWGSAATAALLLAVQLPALSFAAASVAVLMNRYLFFVSVVPRSTALTFLGATGKHERIAA